MGYCCVPLCKNCDSKRRDLSFYRFPKDDKILRKWLKAIRRENWTPTESSRICSWHFPEGREKGPSLFDWNIKKQFRYSEPELKEKSRKLEMPLYCSAYGCKNKHGESTKQRRISFHRFPAEKDVRRQWIIKVNRADCVGRLWEPKKGDVLCSEHFVKSDFIQQFGRKTVKPGAVPTLFSHSKKLKTRKALKERFASTVTPMLCSEGSFVNEAAASSSDHQQYEEERIDRLLPCAALNCSSDTSCRFFRFPKDKDLCLTWIQNCQRDDLLGQGTGFLIENYQLCERHFDDVQFVKRCRTNQLKWNAVPTIFDSSTVDFVKKRLNSDSETSCKRLKSDPSNDTSFNCGNELPSHFADFVGTDPSVQGCAETPNIDILSLSNVWSIDTIIHSAKQLGMRGPMLEFFEEQLKKCFRDNKQTISVKNEPSDLVSSQPSQNEDVGPKARVVVQQCCSAKLMVKPATETTPDLFVQINRGIVVFVCFLQGSSSETVQKLAKTVLNVRLSEAVDGKLVSVLDLPGDVLIVPQATLGGRIKGTAMQYHKNLDKALGEQLYNDFADAVQKIFDVNTSGVDHGCSVLKGTYGNQQVLSVDTNGPYTHLIEI